jgi:hypothetical protein
MQSPCRLEESDVLSNRDAFENSTKYFFSQLYDYYFGSAGRGQFCNMTLPIEKWSLLQPVDLSAPTQGRTRKHYDINDYLQHRLVSYNNSDTVQPWQFFFNGEVCFKYEPAPNGGKQHGLDNDGSLLLIRNHHMEMVIFLPTRQQRHHPVKLALLQNQTVICHPYFTSYRCCHSFCNN